MDATGQWRNAASTRAWGARLVEMARWAAAMHVEERASADDHGAGDLHGVRGTQAEALARWADEARRNAPAHSRPGISGRGGR